MQPLYLDHNATTPPLPEVIEAMAECDRAGYANPASQHAAGRKARQVLEDAREGMAQLLGARLGNPADQLIFTSGGTEANNLALRGLLPEKNASLVVSAIEHPSVAETADFLESHGTHVARLGVDRLGVTRATELDPLLSASLEAGHPPQLVSVMLGNNETGVLQPVADLAAIAHNNQALMHTDAVQVVGKLPVNFASLGVDALTFSAHKFHGPRGIGGLLLRTGVKLHPQLFGGFQQNALRPGTEPVTLAVGMHMALRAWAEEANERAARMATVRDGFEQALLAQGLNIEIHGRAAPRLPHTSNISFLGCNRQSLLMALDLAGIACSTGSACASGSSDPSPCLVAMGVGEAAWDSALRFSWGAHGTPAEAEESARRISLVVNNLQNAIGARNLMGKTRG